MSYFGSKEFYLEIAKGNIPGHSHVNKFGHNESIDTGTVPETVWDQGGVWVPPTAARTHDIASTSANDTGTVRSSGTATSTTTTTLVDTAATFSTDGVAVGDAVLDDTGGDHSYVLSVDSETQLTIQELHHQGEITSGNSYRVVAATSTGASVVHIKKGLDANGLQQTEYIVMNGTTPVSTASTYYRITRLHVDGCGSNKSNVGTITATAQTDATVQATIPAAHGQTLMAIDTVPAGKLGYITGWYASLARSGGTAVTADIELCVTPYGLDNPFGNRILHQLGLTSVGSSYLPHKFDPPVVLEPLTDVFSQVTYVSANGLRISSGFDMILVDI